MKEFDKNVVISDDIRGDQLLENSGLTRDQKNMILVSTQNSLSYDAVKDALLAQHGMQHVKSHNYNSSDPRPRSYSGKGKGRSYGKSRYGYMAELYDERDLDGQWYQYHEELPEAYTAEEEYSRY